ncbi:bifunctional folylpolyglutamate synthase/dihydrofolate synthase [Aquamicrobium lusatiense]|uniref:bifunctional folylpolyglutamate synthase/dihydrofolate synthase n=1 Tax=Aquamicrobium lusatiense TaxID=89772 RepID=UPI0024539929|nr:folylpolyglutamate synthase/dihydrofolate synthase family protein [Aquamicrobium lusatiense]MDH4992282.1 bifunctional folylpolyglutamate synthase/dihydrofolate synthase [Aquamicrobium lusatiense]
MNTLSAEREIEHLMTLHPKGFDLSLDRVSRLLDKLGNPQDHMPPAIHIAGTNGKGSCAAFTRAILEAQGLLVHTHTSPHLVNWHERYRIAADGGSRLVDDATLAEAIARVAKANDGQQITVFEILSAVGFLLFSEHPADVVVMEVGLGGRFDATNVIARPAASVIMPVSMDHEAYLGDRVELIAAEKAGIIKQGCPVVIGSQPHEAALEVLADTAARLGCPTHIYGQDFFAFAEHGRMVYQDQDGLMDLSLPRMTGRHQLANASAAIAAVKAAGFDPRENAIDRAMTTASWPGRMQKLPHGKLMELAPAGAEIWVDGGHNPGAGIVISEALAELEQKDPRPLFMIAGMINTKDQSGYFHAFNGLVKHVYTVPVDFSDASVGNDELAVRASAAGLSAEPVSSVANALMLLRDNWQETDVPPRVLIGGSLYLVGAVLAENGTPPT